MKVATHSMLLAENRRLKEQLAELRSEQPPIAINPAQGTVKIRNLHTDSFSIERLDAQGEAITRMADTMSQVERWVNPRPDFSDVGSLEGRLTVTDLKATLPFRTLNKMIPKLSGPQLREAGIQSLSFSAGDKPDEIRIRGRVRKLLEVGFEASGSLSVSKSGEAGFRLEKSRVAGIPMPDFVTGLATALFAGGMTEMGVRKQGETFLVDPKKFIPKNIDAQVTSLSVNRSGIVVES